MRYLNIRSHFFCFLCSFYFFCLPTPFLADDGYIILENQAKMPLLTPALAHQQTLKMKLANQLEAYLISDPEAVQSAAALTVQVGSWDDPKDYPGLAHFLEHMLFLGTKKYPAESEFDRFIQEHGGESNAYTSSDHTLYAFSVDNEAFLPALDRFASFFKEPLFNPSGVTREMQAIDQEFARNLQDDEIRFLFIQKRLSPLEHPFYHFGNGNSATLAKVSREILKEWYQKNYSANLMHLIVYSPLPLETLQKVVAKDFKEVPNSERPVLKTDLPLITKENRGKIIYAEPFNHVRTLHLLWELPPKFAHEQETRPADLLCSILGDERVNGLLAHLKQQNLAEAIDCSNYHLGPDQLLFSINITLTEEGLKQINSVISDIFEIIRFLQSTKIPPYIFDEIKKIDTLRYQYQERQSPFELLMEMGEWMLREDLSTFPERTLMVQKFDPLIVHTLLNELTPQNMVAFVIAKPEESQVQLEQIEPWMHIPYTIQSITPQQLKAWSQSQKPDWFQFPPPNPFIPTQIKLVKSSVKESPSSVPKPELLLESAEGKIYYAKDHQFLLPQALWFLQIKTPAIEEANPTKMALADLYIRCLKDLLDPYSYAAHVADLNFLIEVKNNSLNLTIQGYSGKIETLFNLVLKVLKSSYPSEEAFNLYKESLYRTYQNASQKSPMAQAIELFKTIIYKQRATEEEKALALKAISYQQFIDYLTHLFAKTYIQALFYGDVEKNKVLTIWQKLHHSLSSHPYPLEEHPPTMIATLPQTPYLLIKPSTLQGNALLLGIESPTFSFKTKGAQEILAKIVEEAFYDALRTKQQTGYLVYHQAEEVENHLFSLFGIQSNTHDPQDLLMRVELFIENFLTTVIEKDLSEDIFKKIGQSLIFTLEHPAQNIEQMGELLKTLIIKYRSDFDRLNQRIQALKDLTYKEFLEISTTLLDKQNKRRLAILIKGRIPQDKSLHYQPLNNIEQIKQLIEYHSTY